MRNWIDHFISACGWSASGLRQLFASEVAARMELAAALAALAWLLWLGCSWPAIGGFVVLALVALAIEALNTAIEAIVDEVSPQRSAFAAKAKDLGSAAVALALAATGLYVLGLTVLAFL
ncbi:MAG: diacylglycerol kinase [Rhizobiales bacterium]|nr:diacylglycerol kinase [Hyphomicrobiales bacterium]